MTFLIHGSTLKVTIKGTPRQCTEAWAIVQEVLERYPVVEAFMVRYPPPPPSLEDTATPSVSGELCYVGAMVRTFSKHQGVLRLTHTTSRGTKFSASSGVLSK